ncbi:MAG: hypothetical protein RLZZ543_1688 [Bacteroidota bacterium]|jgi:hypothetical protein
MKKALLFILLFISGFSFSQNILVPYRKGQLWGLADTLGKQVCAPQYDQVLFKDEFGKSFQIELPDNYFYVKKGNKSGVFSTKEIIPPKYERIQCVDKAFFGCSDDAGGNLKYWYALDGTSLLPEGYSAQSLVGQFKYNYSENHSRYYCYIVKATNASYGIYYFDTQAPKRSRFLMKDCHRIKYKRDEQTQEMEFTVDVSINVSKKHGHLRYNKAKEEIELYFESEKDYTKRLEEQRTTSYQEREGMDEMMIEAPPVVEPDGINAPKKGVAAPIKTYMRCNFQLKADSLVLRMVNARFMRTGKTSMSSLISIPQNVEKIKLVNYIGYSSFGVQKSDTLFQYSNFVTFELRFKKGLLVSDIAIPFYADSILQIRTDGFNDSGWSFLFGQKDKSGKMLLGWMTAEGKEMIPAMYEDIQFKSSFVSPEYNYASDKWIVTQSGKVGMIDPKGATLLDTKYDEITLVGKSFSSPIYRLLKKDGKYGVYYLENEGVYTGKEWILCEPFTPYKITALRFIPRGKSKMENYFTLYRLEDEVGNLIGYRSRSGIDFFEN